MDVENEFNAKQLLVVENAMTLLSNGGSCPHIECYFPKTKNEIEIQQFNLYGRLPQRLTSEEDISMWILEGEHINRSKVYDYLGTVRDPPMFSSTGVRLRREDVPKTVLKLLASKICSLELAKGFVEGMKFFVPVVGCWDAVCALSTTVTDVQAKQVTASLHRILTEYVLAHLKYSDKPIFPTGSVHDGNINLVVEIALSVLTLSLILHEGVKSNAAAMADFFASLRSILREQQDPSPTTGMGSSNNNQRNNQNDNNNNYNEVQFLQATTQSQVPVTALSLSMKAMTDLFTATSTNLSAVSLSQSALRSRTQQQYPHQHQQRIVSSAALLLNGPSYLFSFTPLKGHISLATNLEEPFTAYFARLASDAIYLFEPTPSCTENNCSTTSSGGTRVESGNEALLDERGVLLGCIPLECVHLRTDDAARTSLLSLVPIRGVGLPLISYHSHSHGPQETAVIESSEAVGTNSRGEMGNEAPAVKLPHCAPRAVVYHPVIYLRLGDAQAGAGHNVVNAMNSNNRCCAFELWVDSIELAAWECRATHMSVKR